MCLRTYEMSLNEKKTQIMELPRPSTENWIQRLNCFVFPGGGDIKISMIRAYLDLALECAQKIGKSTPLNYAIKSLAGRSGSRKLNERAMRMYTQEAINLALAYPYLAPLLDKYVFDKFPYPGQSDVILKFCTSLVELGLQRLYSDAIAHALYYAIKFDVKIDLSENKLSEIIALDDCLTNVILLEYSEIYSLSLIKKRLKKLTDGIKKSGDRRDIGRNWLLVYKLWSDGDLKGNGQDFLLELKNRDVSFFNVPKALTVTEKAP